MSLITLWTVESGEKCRWFVTEKAARLYAHDTWLKEEDGVPFVSHKVIWDDLELCEILNHIEGFTEVGESQLGAYPPIDICRAPAGALQISSGSYDDRYLFCGRCQEKI